MVTQNYKYFSDARRYQPRGLLHPENAKDEKRKKILEGYSPTRYQLNESVEYWFDGRFNQVRTSEEGFFLQAVASSDLGEVQRRVFVAINGRRVQFSRKNNETLISPVSVPPKKKNGKWIWEIEEIGSDLNFYTGYEDSRHGIDRPIEERQQCLTNASKFATRADLSKAVELVEASFSTFGNIFGADATFGRETPGGHAVEFSKALTEKIVRGEYADL